MTIPPLIVYGTTIIRMGQFHYSREAFRLIAWADTNNLLQLCIYAIVGGTFTRENLYYAPQTCAPRLVVSFGTIGFRTSFYTFYSKIGTNYKLLA